MKAGSEGDPFADDGGEDGVQESAGAGHERERESEQGVVTEAREMDAEPSRSEPDDEIPYIPRRKIDGHSVKHDRDETMFFLREQFRDRNERRFVNDIEQILGADVSVLDVREAAYAFAQEHPEGVAEKLREWGANF